MVNQIEFVS